MVIPLVFFHFADPILLFLLGRQDTKKNRMRSGASMAKIALAQSDLYLRPK